MSDNLRPPFPHDTQRRLLLKGSGAVLLLGACRAAQASEIVAVRVWPAEDYSRVTIESVHALKTTHQTVESPPRLAVDIDGLQLDATLRDLVIKVRADDPNIAGVRIGQYSADVVRLVFDLKHRIRPEVFTLKPVAAYRNRLVFDLYPAIPPDPLAELLAGMSTPPAIPFTPAPSPATTVAAAPADALGDLIAQQIERANRAVTPPSQGAISAAPPAPPSKQRPPALAKVPPQTAMQRLIVVAVDPGHGGEDPGALGSGGTREKDVVLQIALKLRDRINRASVGGNPMRAFLTRDADFFVPLGTRVEKARRVQADLFVSIHADSAPGSGASGASVYALSERGATSTTARWLAKSENESDLIGGVNLSDKGSFVQQTLLDMSTTAQIRDSMNLGRVMLGNIRSVGPLHKRTVERANFAVLRNPDVPSILVETAFISNPDEERKLKSASYQNEMADAMLDGIRKYFAAHPPLARNRAV